MVQPARTRGVYQTTRRKWISNWRLTTALSIGLILSLASLYTTWDGLVNYIAPDPDKRAFVPQLLAFGVASGIQSIMLLSAWFVGIALVQVTEPHRSLSSRVRVLGEATVWTIMFVATLIASVFFSYHTFYTAIAGYFPDGSAARATSTATGPSDREARGNRSPHINNLAEIHVRRAVAASLTEMRSAAEAQRQTYFEGLTQPRSGLSKDARTMLKETPSLEAAADAWAAYLGRMDSFIKFVEKVEPRIEGTSSRLRTDAIKNDRDLAGQTATQQDILDRNRARLAQVDTTIETLEKQITTLEGKTAELKSQIDGFEKRARDARFRMQCESGGTECPIGARARRGVGPLYRAADADRRDAETRRGQVQEQLRAEDESLQKARTEKDKLVIERSALKRDVEATSVGLEGLTSTRRVTVTGSQLRTSDQLKGDVAKMREALEHLTGPAEFGELKSKGSEAPASSDRPSPSPVATPNGTALTRLEEQCGKLLAYLSDERFDSVAQDARGYSCAQAGLGRAIERVQELNAGLRRFDEHGCRTLGNDFRNTNTAALIERGRQCLELVALDGAPADGFMQTFGQLSREHNASVHPFVQSLNGLTVYNDKLAYLSILLAAMIDMLVFFIGIIGGRESLRRIDRIGQELRGDEVLGLGLAASKIGRPTDSEEIMLARLVLNRLVPQDYVPDPVSAPHVRYSGYILDSDLERGIAENDLVRRQIQMWMSTPKSGVDLVLRLPRPAPAQEQCDTGIHEPDAERVEEPVRFFFLRELIIDLAEDIVHWDRTHAASASDAATAAPPADHRAAHPPRNAPQPAPAAPFWRWTRTESRGNSGGTRPNGSGASTADADHPFRIVRTDEAAPPRPPDGDPPPINGPGKPAPAT